ncbi:MAG TPA: hypothetical protein DD400_01570 [Rhodospirillaceae bacterium]|nr:hypothetical protein [Rhodospirillaceae bacterium]
MPLAISNIFWSQEEDDKALPLARSSGAKGIEVAPTRIAPWGELNVRKAKDYRQRLKDLDLQIPSLQAILYGCKDMQLLGEEDAFNRLLEHFKFVAEIAGHLGAMRLVFGAPKYRLRGALGEKEAFDLAVKRLGPVAQIMKDAGVTLVFEAVPATYGCDFIQSTQEARQLVKAVNHDGLRLHLDIGAMITAQEEPETLVQKSASLLSHVHFSVPGLGFLTELGDIGVALDSALVSINYAGWIALEIMPQKEALENLEKMILLARGTFIHTLAGES